MDQIGSETLACGSSVAEIEGATLLLETFVTVLPGEGSCDSSSDGSILIGNGHRLGVNLWLFNGLLELVVKEEIIVKDVSVVVSSIFSLLQPIEVGIDVLWFQNGREVYA